VLFALFGQTLHLACSTAVKKAGLLYNACKKGEGKGHTLDTAPLSEGTSLQKHSGMARVVEGFHSFTYTPVHLSTNGINHTCL